MPDSFHIWDTALYPQNRNAQGGWRYNNLEKEEAEEKYKTLVAHERPVILYRRNGTFREAVKSNVTTNETVTKN